MLPHPHLPTSPPPLPLLSQDKIDALAAAHPSRFKVYYVVDKPSWGGMLWKGGVGYITKVGHGMLDFSHSA